MTRLAVVDDDVSTRADARRALLRFTIRSGDLPAAARAASRARLVVMRLEPDETERGRLARRRFGRALRMARARRAALAVLPAPTTLASRAPAAAVRRRPPLAAAGLSAAMLLVLMGSDSLVPSPDARDAALIEFICTRVMKAPESGTRPEPVSVPAPQYYGADLPDATGATRGVDRTDLIRNGFARLVGRVVDDATGLPLDDACLEFSRASGPIRARTDASGIFIIDLPIITKPIDLVFGRAGYRPARVTLESWGARSVSFFFDVRLSSQ